MAHPPLTVGMPVYNDPEGLRRTVPSIFGQTWAGPIRLVVVDDGSTDDTPGVLDALAEMYGPIEVVRHETNLGRPVARNRIIELAGDDYLAWTDAGDLWQPRKLELQFATLLDAERADPHTRFLCTGALHWVFADREETMIRSPDVSGDQLYQALTGAIFPYLQAILARAEHFRAAGGFDERLPRRQDYDFLVRFIADGGRVVSTPADAPLFTYLKSDRGSSAEQVAVANRVIRRKHRPYYDRYGNELMRQIHSQQHRLVARFHKHNGNRGRSRMHRMWARAWSPEFGAAARRQARRVWPPRRLAGNVAKGTVRLLRPAMPLLRQPRVIELARKFGVARLLAGDGGNRALYDLVRSEVQDVDARAARPGSGTETSREIESLEKALAGDTASQGSDPWLRLEQAYRARGWMHSAEVTLQRGLTYLPGDPAIRVRLVELMPLRKKWSECLELWGKHGDDLHDAARGLTYARIARAHRELGDPRRALAAAEEGLRRWPHDNRVWQEIYLNRAALVDWSAALGPASTDVEPEAAEPHGAVTAQGFLAGGPGPLSGHLPADAPTGQRVYLRVNGVVVAGTHAGPSGPDGVGFALSCHDLLPYLGDGDVVLVESSGGPVPIDGVGTHAVVTTGYRSRVDELRDKLETGYVFTKMGELRMSYTPEAKAHMFHLYSEVEQLLAERYGYPAFPFYGNLLGAVREHDFIAHDVGGFDMGYISRHQRPEEVRAEFMDVCRALLDQGYFLRVEPWSTYVRSGYRDRAFVDVNYAWFDESGELHFSFGWRSDPVTDRERVFFRRECPIGPHLVRVPGNAEEVLDQLYGRHWAVPDQGFGLEEGLRRSQSFILTVDEMRQLEHRDPDHVELRLDHHPDVEV